MCHVIHGRQQNFFKGGKPNKKATPYGEKKEWQIIKAPIKREKAPHMEF